MRHILIDTTLRGWDVGTQIVTDYWDIDRILFEMCLDNAMSMCNIKCAKNVHYMLNLNNHIAFIDADNMTLLKDEPCISDYKVWKATKALYNKVITQLEELNKSADFKHELDIVKLCFQKTTEYYTNTVVPSIEQVTVFTQEDLLL